MEKMTLNRFKEIKSDVIELLDLLNQLDSHPEWINKKFELYKKELKSHNLGEIGFDEYKGFIDIGFDFEGTGANLDFSMIDFSRRWILSEPAVRVKGCNIRNVDLSIPDIFYDDNSFDEEFMQAHPKYFLDKDVTDAEVRERYYLRMLTLQDLETYNLEDDSYIKNLNDENLNFDDYYDDEDDLNLRRTAEIVGIKNLLHIGANLIKIFEKEIYQSIYDSNLDRTSSAEEVEIIAFARIKDRSKVLYNLDNDDAYNVWEKLLEDLKKVHYSDSLKSMVKYGLLSLEDVMENPEIFKEYINNIGYILEKAEIETDNIFEFILKLNGNIDTVSFIVENEELMKYIADNEISIYLNKDLNKEKILEYLENKIEKAIFSDKIKFNDKIPTFFKEKYPEFFLDDDLPLELKEYFYNNITDFQLLKEHPEWKEYLQAVNLNLAFPKKYRQLFNISSDISTILKFVTRYPETVKRMVLDDKVHVLENWYKSTGGKFVPHHVVMLNFPESEIDSFLGNSKKWSQLMRIENYNLNDDSKAAILKASYAMGVFQGDDNGFNRTMKLFTDVPQELTQEEYEKVTSLFNGEFDPFGWSGSNFDPKQKDEEMKSLFKQAYTLNNDGRYVFSIDKQKNKDSVKMVREILEKAQIPRILTPEKAHQMFDSFAMEYNSDFVRFFYDNIEEILSNPEYTKNIATIQRQFKDIVRTNAGRRLTLDVAQDYIKGNVYTDIEIGNEEVAEQAKIAGYSQKDFEAIQSLFNEGEIRDFSSIPRIQGKTNGYTYEMLRCDDPLALTIGTLTDCCQKIHGIGQTSMEHSVVSPDGRVFCVRDNEGRLVAQSWFWRNQYTGCFDSIEISQRIFDLYKKEHPYVGIKGLITDVLEVYKKAAQDLMQEDERVYKELLENETITQEQYDALLLGRVTIGAGYNDINFALREMHSKGEIKLDASNEVLPKKNSRFSYIYDDLRDGQYIIAERDGIIKSAHENLYVHQDDIPVFDRTNMSSTVLLIMKRMEQATGRENLKYLSERSDEKDFTKSQRIINSIAREYGLDPNSTKVMATARIALIYSKDKDNKVKIGELLSSPLKTGLTEEQKQKSTEHIMHQVKKALKQIGAQDSEVDFSSLSEKERQILQSVMQEIEEENDKRGER